MSHFYSTCQGNRGEGTRCGTKGSGVVTEAAGWKGCISVRTWHNEERGVDMFRVSLIPWSYSGGSSKLLAEGVLDSNVACEQFTRTDNFPYWLRQKIRGRFG